MNEILIFMLLERYCSPKETKRCALYFQLCYDETLPLVFEVKNELYNFLQKYHDKRT